MTLLSLALMVPALLSGGCAWWNSLWHDTLAGPYYSLNDAEKAAITWAFGDAIDMSEIRLVANKTEGTAPARAVGNLIVMRPGEDPADEALRSSPAHLALIVHEATHVWQFQTGGPEYVLDAVSHNLEALAEKGDRGQAYVYELTEQLDLRSMRAEPQAKLIEEWYALANHGTDPFRCLNWGSLGGTEFLRVAGTLIPAALGPESSDNSSPIGP